MMTNRDTEVQYLHEHRDATKYTISNSFLLQEHTFWTSWSTTWSYFSTMATLKCGRHIEANLWKVPLRAGATTKAVPPGRRMAKRVSRRLSRPSSKNRLEWDKVGKSVRLSSFDWYLDYYHRWMTDVSAEMENLKILVGVSKRRMSIGLISWFQWIDYLIYNPIFKSLFSLCYIIFVLAIIAAAPTTFSWVLRISLTIMLLLHHCSHLFHAQATHTLWMFTQWKFT